jgi:hypothetical protein
MLPLILSMMRGLNDQFKGASKMVATDCSALVIKHDP